MKVTVCFGVVRIVVPCGNGDLLVKDLINEAIRRYRKATGKEPDSWVSVQHLQTQSGILDPDDCIRDVADDREQILASFEDTGPDPGVPQGGGDGASGSSSVGTGSPDIFRDTNAENAGAKAHGLTIGDRSTPHIEVTSTTPCPLTGLGLQVRRSSDPNLIASLKAEGGGGGGNKRWSAAAPHCAGDSPERVLQDKNNSSYLTPQWEEEDDGQLLASSGQIPATVANQQPQHFARSGRLSMQFLGDGTGYRWMEAAEKLQQSHHHQHSQQSNQQQQQQQHQHHHQQQLLNISQPEQYSFSHSQHGNNNNNNNNNNNVQNQYDSNGGAAYSTKSLPRDAKRKEPLGQAYESIREKDGEMLLVINEPGGPLGLTAIPDYQNRGGGLLVQNVEPGSRADRGRLRRGDRILEINGLKLLGLSEFKVQEHLRQSLEASELRIRVIRAESLAGGGPGGGGKMRRRDSKVAEMIAAEEKFARSTNESKVATVSPTRKSHVTAPVGTSALQVANTRKLGRKIEIVLKKGPNGLGFSVTTRDNPAGGHCPIYIKNILPRGAAIEDGRLKPGDRLLEVDGVPMTGKTQTDVVALLRATQSGAVVSIVVSRQQQQQQQQDPPKTDEQEIKPGNKLDITQSPSKVSITAAKHHPETGSNNNNNNNNNNNKNDQMHSEVRKSSSARSLFEQHHRQQQYSLNESQHFIDGGSESAASNDSIQAGVSWRSREVLTLHIPVHDTEKAGLGVSVKGKTSSNLNTTSSSGEGSNNNNSNKSQVKHDGDLGIFVKNVLHGGAASRDGRLQMNDQLMSVNGVSLLGQNNAEAMETLRRAMVTKPGKHPGMITLTVARKLSRSISSNDIIEQQTNDSSNNSENSGATVIYLSPDKKDARIAGGQGSTKGDANRWSNPVLDRLTGGGGGGSSSTSYHTEQLPNGIDQSHYAGLNPLRNDSYYIATNDTWSPAVNSKQLPGTRQFNNAVLIEDDPEPTSPTLPHRHNESTITQNTSTSSSHPTATNFDATYSSQLSLETNNSGVEHFSRDALGRRSISEKHHAALDARETGTYQRNKKLREERERRIQLTKSAVFSGSMESLTVRIANANAQIPGYKHHAKTASGIDTTQQLQKEAQDEVGDLGPSLGMKKSSSLESLQTMVQEIQMSDEPRGPSALRAPRGRVREDSLRAAVVSDIGNKSRKHWLLEETDGEGGFANRNGPFQSSLNDGKHKSRAKKPSILRGIGHMFRFGKNRKDVVAPIAESMQSSDRMDIAPPPHAKIQYPAAALSSLERNMKLPPPAYQPPPALPHPNNNSMNSGGPSNVANNNNNGIHQSDIFNHRYQHYSNYEEMYQHQLSRRHQHYHSQRSARSQDLVSLQPLYGYGNNNNNNNNGLRPTSSYYEYETVQHPSARGRKNSNEHRMPNNNSNNNSGGHQKGNLSASSATTTTSSLSSANNGNNEGPPLPPSNVPSPQQQQHSMPQWKFAALNGFSPQSLNSSARSRGPFVTQVTIRDSGSSPGIGTTQTQSHPIHAGIVQHQHSQFVGGGIDGGTYVSSSSGCGQSQASKV